MPSAAEHAGDFVHVDLSFRPKGNFVLTLSDFEETGAHFRCVDRKSEIHKSFGCVRIQCELVKKLPAHDDRRKPVVEKKTKAGERFEKKLRA